MFKSIRKFCPSRRWGEIPRRGEQAPKIRLGLSNGCHRIAKPSFSGPGKSSHHFGLRLNFPAQGRSAFMFSVRPIVPQQVFVLVEIDLPDREPMVCHFPGSIKLIFELLF